MQGANSKHKDLPLKVVVFTPIWGRHDIVKIWQKGVERIKNYNPQVFEIIPFCMVSNKEDRELIESFGYDYIETENKPLGRKHNKGLEALKDREFDYILQLGSDDLITNEYLHYLLSPMLSREPVFGVNRLLFCEPSTEKACRFELTTQDNILIGAGRCISYEAIEALNFNLWPNDINRGLDMTSQANLYEVGAMPFSIATGDFCVLDVKSDTNIWSYNNFGNNYPKVEYKEVKRLFPEI